MVTQIYILISIVQGILSPHPCNLYYLSVFDDTRPSDSEMIPLFWFTLPSRFMILSSFWCMPIGIFFEKKNLLRSLFLDPFLFWYTIELYEIFKKIFLNSPSSSIWFVYVSFPLICRLPFQFVDYVLCYLGALNKLRIRDWFLHLAESYLFGLSNLLILN